VDCDGAGEHDAEVPGCRQQQLEWPLQLRRPDGTAATFFATSGADISQFSGNRYFKYKAFLASTDSTVTPTLSDVTTCFDTRWNWSRSHHACGRPAGAIYGHPHQADPGPAGAPRSVSSSDPTNTTLPPTATIAAAKRRRHPSILCWPRRFRQHRDHHRTGPTNFVTGQISPPTLSPVTIASNNANTTLANRATRYVSFTASEPSRFRV